MSAMLLRVIQGEALGEVGTSWGQFAQPETRHPRRQVGLQEERWSVQALGQNEELRR
jgi:hypothetical protein